MSPLRADHAERERTRVAALCLVHGWGEGEAAGALRLPRQVVARRAREARDRVGGAPVPELPGACREHGPGLRAVALGVAASGDPAFAHAAACPDCLAYVMAVRRLAGSLGPESLSWRLVGLTGLDVSEPQAERLAVAVVLACLGLLVLLVVLVQALV